MVMWTSAKPLARTGQGRHQNGRPRTFANLDLDAGVALGYILHAAHYTRHGGQLCGEEAPLAG
jgi:hypothetical protein